MSPESHAIVFADPAGRIRYWSPGAERLFGHDSSQALGQSLDVIVPEEFRERHWAAFHRAMQTAECGLDRAAAHLPVLCGDGRVRVFPARFTFVTDGHGRAVGALAVYGQEASGAQPWSPITPEAGASRT